MKFPVRALDLESTGPDPETARIVQAAYGVALSPGEWKSDVSLVHPGIPIPADATAIHHITDDMVSGAVHERKMAGLLRDRLYTTWAQGGTVVGTNIVYDLTLLDRALQRAGEPKLEIRGLIIDTYVIDKKIDRYRRGSRRLKETCQHYGVDLHDAHDAGADSYAALRLAWRILQFRWRNDMPLMAESPHWLMAFQAEAYAEQQQSLHAYFRRKGTSYEPWSTSWPLVARFPEETMEPGFEGALQ